MKLLLVLSFIFSTTMALGSVASKSPAKVGIKVGGKVMYVDHGGQLTSEDVSVFSVPVTVLSIEGTASGRATVPVAGSISSIKCLSDAAISDTPTVLTASINGVAITNGAVTILSVGSNSYTKYTATPTAANTVAVGDMIKVTSDGGTNTSSNAACILLITP